MSNRSSTSPRPHSSPNPLPSTSRRSPSPQRSPAVAHSMLQVARPALAPSASLGALPSQYTSYPFHYTTGSPSYIVGSLSPPPVTHQSTPPPDIMRTFERGRGVKRGRSEDKSDEDDHQASMSGSETDGNSEQPVLPAPKKRTRTLMTPDQLTSLHRLLSMVSTCCALRTPDTVILNAVPRHVFRRRSKESSVAVKLD
jgi:hypothetical protein